MPCVFIEPAKSNCSNCRYAHCGSRLLSKGELRIAYRSCNVTAWYHPKCFVLANRGQQGYELEELRGHHALGAEDRTRIAVILETYYSDRAALKLKKHVFEMSANELKEECRKRDLRAAGKKADLQDRLRDYLEDGLCLEYKRKDSVKLVAGYSKQIIKKEYKLELPICLEKLILKFYPINVL